MSTKIYGGRIIRDCDLNLAYSRLLDAKPAAQKIAHEQRAKFLAIRATEMIDRRRLASETVHQPLDNSAFNCASGELMNRMLTVAKERRRDPAIDFSMEVYLFKLPEHVLLILNVENCELREWFDSLPYVEDFHYQDNCDKPDDVSEGDWAGRRFAWDVALGESGVPADRCLTFEFIPETGYVPLPKVEDIMAYVPDNDQRARTIAHDRVLASRMLHEERTNGPCPEKEPFAHYYAASTWMRGEEGSEVLSATIKGMLERIKPITVADLEQKLRYVR